MPRLPSWRSIRSFAMDLLFLLSAGAVGVGFLLLRLKRRKA
jgi:hypothetical protein